MTIVSLDTVSDHFEDPESPWSGERRLVEDFFKKPAIRLTAAIFGIYPHSELPYWDFKADARRHAIRCVRNGNNEHSWIIGDYNRTVWTPSRELILSGKEYDALINEQINELPYGSGKISYAQTIKARFGFDGKVKGPDTLSEEFDLDVGKIRDLERRALSVLRHRSKSDEIKSYLEEVRWEFVRKFYSG